MGYAILTWTGIVLGALLGIGLVLLVVGSFLPRSHRVRRGWYSKQSVDTLWQTIADVAATPSWHPLVLQVERLPDRQGHPVWRETYKGDYRLQLETTLAEPPLRLTRTIADEGGPFSGRWELVLTPTESGALLTITEFGAIPNPFFRLMARLFMNPAYYMELYLQMLARKFNEAALIEVLEASGTAHGQD